MLIKLAFRNVKRQFSCYAIYFITVTLTITMIFAVNNIIQSDIMSLLLVAYFDGVKDILTGLTGLLALIMAFVLGYATNFLLKKRKKEFALYLVMGMNRRNIIGIFMFETALTFIFALGAGILLGLLFYQALMGVFTSYMELDYTLSGYSPVALLYTIIIVCAVFLLSSAASAGYLKFEKISKLLNSEKIAEKTVRHPVIWVLAAVAGIAGTFIAMSLFIDWLNTVFFETFYLAALIIAFAIASVILGSMGICKGITWLIVRARSGRAKSTAMFTARQISSGASANAVMTGLLAVLMSLAIIGPNIFFSISDIYTRQTNEDYLYDISGGISSFEFGEDIDGATFENTAYTYVKEYTGKISKYAKIEKYAVLFVYEQYTDPDSYYHKTLVKHSQFVEACKVVGYTLPEETGQNFDCTTSDKSTDPFEWSYGLLRCPNDILLNYADDFSVVSDSQTDGMTPAYGILCVDVADEKYDARALEAEVNPIDDRNNKINRLTIKEYERLDMLGQGGLFMLGDLYCSAVFLLLTLAIFSLKMMSTVSQDKQKYKIMWRLGTTKAQLFRSMFAQMAFFCFLPFIIPVLINIPLLSIIAFMYRGYGMTLPGETALQLAGYTLSIIGVCLLYLIAASIVSWLDIRHSLKEES